MRGCGCCGCTRGIRKTRATRINCQYTGHSAILNNYRTYLSDALTLDVVEPTPVPTTVVAPAALVVVTDDMLELLPLPLLLLLLPDEVILNCGDWARMVLRSCDDLTRLTWKSVPVGRFVVIDKLPLVPSTASASVCLYTPPCTCTTVGCPGQSTVHATPGGARNTTHQRHRKCGRVGAHFGPGDGVGG